MKRYQFALIAHLLFISSVHAKKNECNSPRKDVFAISQEWEDRCCSGVKVISYGKNQFSRVCKNQKDRPELLTKLCSIYIDTDVPEKRQQYGHLQGYYKTCDPKAYHFKEKVELLSPQLKEEIFRLHKIAEKRTQQEQGGEDALMSHFFGLAVQTCNNTILDAMVTAMPNYYDNHREDHIPHLNALIQDHHKRKSKKQFPCLETMARLQVPASTQNYAHAVTESLKSVSNLLNKITHSKEEKQTIRHPEAISAK
ncbi:MAG: hypothetical protein CL678_03690 [Bdellovibrionaceae bacterium]|nr:hypothetical protein [Pseudobdellovibrionaceae bacterium]|tara:strand:- start:2383 stop:3144 length:762 start_codon:yes stop_codon:yes gene_type:complete